MAAQHLTPLRVDEYHPRHHDVEMNIPSTTARTRLKNGWQHARRYLFILLSSLLVIATVSVTLILVYVNNKPFKKPKPDAKLLTEFYNYYLSEFPQVATSLLGKGPYTAGLENMTITAISNRLKKYEMLDAQIKEMLSDTVSSDLGLNARILQVMLSNLIGEIELNTYLMPVTHMQGPHLDLNLLMQRTEIGSADDLSWFLSRLAAIPLFMEQQIQLMRVGILKKVVIPKLVVGYVIDQLDVMLHEPTNLFFAPLLRASINLTNEQQTQAQQLANGALQSFQSLKLFMETEYMSAASSTIGLANLPNGDQMYSYLVKKYTTTLRSPEMWHQLGLQEVTRIRARLEEAMRDASFNGTFTEFLTFLKQDDQFYAKTPQEFLRIVRDICMRAEPELPRYFKTLPRCPFGVYPVPASEEKTQSMGYYYGPNKNCTYPGRFYVNTYAENGRVQYPLYLLVSSTLHEAVPGHHLQETIALEANIHPVRSLAYFFAFNEGWALYSESLGWDMGMYDTPYIRFGALGDDMLRACRLVVDTGIHYKNWTREQAIQYMLANMPSTEQAIINQVDRYIAMPGQALSYKAGQLKIMELKLKAQGVYQEKFNVRDFHDAILRNGSLPLDLLEEQVNAYLLRVNR